MKYFLKLGCWGAEREGFKICNGVENNILDLTANSDKNVEITKFLNDNYNLIKQPLYSNIHTSLFRVQDKFNIFEKKYFQVIEQFCILHKNCGLYLKIEETN